MKIAVFFSADPTAGWCMGEGIVRTLRRMGHTVISGPLPTLREASEPLIKMIKDGAPKLKDLANCDAIIVSGPEHIAPWIDLCYTKYEWKQIPVPKACWLHESCHREDYEIDFDIIKWAGDEWFFPAIQDAEFHDQEMFAAGRSHWLPFGVDTEMFRPRDWKNEEIIEIGQWNLPSPMHLPLVEQVFDVGFLGLMYQKRQLYLRALSRHNHPPIRIGMCSVNDLHGYHLEESIQLLVKNTRQMKVFFNLPALSKLLVSKVYETLACGTFLLTPAVPEERGAEQNMKLFTSGEHLVYYSPSNLPYVAQLLREWISPEKDAERVRIAESGCREVHAKHSLKIRLLEILNSRSFSAAACANRANAAS